METQARTIGQALFNECAEVTKLEIKLKREDTRGIGVALRCSGTKCHGRVWHCLGFKCPGLPN